MKYTVTVGNLQVELDPPRGIILKRGTAQIDLTDTDQLRVIERAMGDLKFARKEKSEGA